MPGRPVSRLMPCPDCAHEHLHLPCDWCSCTHVTVPGITLTTPPPPPQEEP